MKRRGVLAAIISVLAAMAMGHPAPAQQNLPPAQIQPGGFQLPWFRSEAEKRARAACENNLPECRQAVRQQIAREKSVTVATPWLVLGIIVLIALFYARKTEKAKQAKRAVAARHHVPGSFRKLDKDKNEKRGEDDEDDDDL